MNDCGMNCSYQVNFKLFRLTQLICSKIIVMFYLQTCQYGCTDAFTFTIQPLGVEYLF
jgi:hypothetical protein